MEPQWLDHLVTSYKQFQIGDWFSVRLVEKDYVALMIKLPIYFLYVLIESNGIIEAISMYWMDSTRLDMN